MRLLAIKKPYNKRFETHSPIVMEFALPPGGGQTPRQLRLRAQAVVIPTIFNIRNRDVEIK
jgi:hypothetical protein